MVRDSVLRHCYSAGGHGKPEWGNSLRSSSSAQAFCIFFNMSAHIYTVLLSTCRENTHSVGRTQKTIFISCKQTHLFMTRIRRPVLLPVRWARTHSRRRTITVATGYFYRSSLMWKTRQRADPCLRAERESTPWVCSDAGIVPFCTHTGTAWQRDLPLVLSNCTNWACVPTLFRCNNLSECVKRLFSYSSATHTFTHNTDKRHHPCGAAMNEQPQGHFSSRVNKHPTTLFYPLSLKLFFIFLVSRSNTRRNLRKIRRSLTTTHSQQQRILSSGSSDMLAPSSVMYVSDNRM